MSKTTTPTSKSAKRDFNKHKKLSGRKQEKKKEPEIDPRILALRKSSARFEASMIVLNILGFMILIAVLLQNLETVVNRYLQTPFWITQTFFAIWTTSTLTRFLFNRIRDKKRELSDFLYEQRIIFWQTAGTVTGSSLSATALLYFSGIFTSISAFISQRISSINPQIIEAVLSIISTVFWGIVT